MRIAPVYARFAQAANAPQLAMSIERKSNGVNGMNTPCWKAVGWTALVGGNPTERIGRSGVNDMEGKVTRVGVSKPGGERVSISQL